MRENDLQKQSGEGENPGGADADAVDASEDGRVVIALCPDMLFASRVRGAGAAQGVEVRVVRSASTLEAAVGEVGARLVLVDLTAARDGVEAIARAKARAPGLRVVAFGRHDDTEALRAAREAGADRVLARSAFVQRLPDLVREAGTESP